MSTFELEKQPERTHRLTLRKSRSSLLVPLGLGLLLCAMSFVALKSRQDIEAGVLGLVALLQFAILPALWKWHVQVKKGVNIVLSRKSSPASDQVVFRNLCIIWSMWTLCVAWVSYLSYFDVYTSKTLAHQLLIIGKNLFIWLGTGFFWHVLLSQRQSAALPVTQEQP